MRPITTLPLFLSLAVILTLGLSVIWSTTPALAMSQAIALGIGIIGAFTLSRLDSSLLQQLRWPLYWTSVILLLITEVIGITTRGSTRWIDLGLFRFQTSEFVKPALIISFASLLSGEERTARFSALMRNLVLIALPAGLIFIQPDLGSALSLAIIWLGIFWQSKMPKKYFLSLLLLSVLLLPVGLNSLKPYQRERLQSFANPYSDPAGSGYNVIQSMIAVGNGRLLGKGVRQGTQSHLRFLPERHTDFAFASFAEEFGFVGVTILLLSFYVALNWLLKLAKILSSFGRLVVIGVFWWIFGQLLINIGMNIGLMPVTGITLPFISYGGSSLLSVMLGLGTVLLFAREGNQQIDI